MCRDKAHGGRRCPDTAEKRQAHNLRRRNRRIVVKAHNLVHVEGEWTGNHPIDIASPTVAKAFVIAVQSHKGVKRISGEPYINHPLRVAQRLQHAGFKDDVVAVALLHDAVEDSDLTLEDLAKHGFSEHIVSGVDSVTKRKGEDYPTAVKRASAHPIGRLVKLSDNLDNSSPEQISPLDPQRQVRAKAKYAAVRGLLLREVTSGQASAHRISVKVAASTLKGIFTYTPQTA